MTVLQVCILLLLILLLMAIGIISCSTFQREKPACSTNIKVEPKKNIIALVFLFIVFLCLLIYLLRFTNTPLEKIASASFEYYSCLELKTKSEDCEAIKNKLLAKTSAAAMVGMDKKLIDQATEQGKYEAKSGKYQCLIKW